MGTRGFYCFLYKGIYYIIYNHWDSYPEGLGETLLRQLKGLSLQELRERLEHNVVVCHGKYPEFTQKVADNFRKFILQDESYFESWLHRSSMYLKNSKTSDLNAIIKHNSSAFYTWILETYGSSEEIWSFLLDRIFCANGLDLKKALSLGYLLLYELPTEKAPENDLFIEFIYIIDLDHEKFLVQCDYEGDEWEFELQELLTDVCDSRESLTEKLKIK